MAKFTPNEKKKKKKRDKFPFNKIHEDEEIEEILLLTLEYYQENPHAIDHKQFVFQHGFNWNNIRTRCVNNPEFKVLYDLIGDIWESHALNGGMDKTFDAGFTRWTVQMRNSSLQTAQEKANLQKTIADTTNEDDPSDKPTKIPIGYKSKDESEDE